MPSGKPVRLLVTVTVQVTVLAPVLPALLHCSITVIGVVENVVVGSWLSNEHVASPVHWMLVVMVAMPTGESGVSGLYVKSLVIVTVQVVVLAPVPAVLLH
jgi:hypothetical protein